MTAKDRIHCLYMFVATSVLLAACAHAAAPSTLAATPPMGWNGWYQFGAKVTEQNIRDAADTMVASGMRDAGYVYLNMDDGWQGKRDSNGVLQPNERFHDMKALADYVHAKGLKLGIYTSPGGKTCAGYPGSLGHEEQDAKTYATWGVDLVKYDLCSFIDDSMKKRHPNDAAAQTRLMIDAYAKMRRAIDASGRPMVYSLCQYGMGAVWEWGASEAVGGNLWRTGPDVGLRGLYWNDIYYNASVQAGLARYAGPGHWNDPDILEVGVTIDKIALSAPENRAHFSLWAIMAAPLLAGNDIAHMTADVRTVLTNRDVIAIDQDPLGQQGHRVHVDGAIEVWTKHLANGDLAVAVFNLGEERTAERPLYLDPAAFGLQGPQTGKDLWTGKTVTLDARRPLTLQTHDVLLVRVHK